MTLAKLGRPGLPAKVYVATEPVNLHLSFDRLAGLVRERFGCDPRDEALYVFHNRRGTHAKILWHDGTGYWIFYKRLDRGTYRIPVAIPAGTPCVKASRRELELLLEGLDRGAVRRARRASKQLARERSISRSTTK